jgi:hypothetical protein
MQNQPNPVSAKLHAAERLARATDADLYLVECTGFFSRLVAEMMAAPTGPVVVELLRWAA